MRLWVGFPHFFGHVSSQDFTYAVGVVENVAGVMVFLLPRFAPYVVGCWLGGIITNLVIISAVRGGHANVFWDIALRDFGLLLTALASARLAVVYAPNPFRRASTQPDGGRVTMNPGPPVHDACGLTGLVRANPANDDGRKPEPATPSGGGSVHLAGHALP